MRTTLDIDDEVLRAAREIAAKRGASMGKVLSELARKALPAPRRRGVRDGVPLLARRRRGDPRPTLETINGLGDEP